VGAHRIFFPTGSRGRGHTPQGTDLHEGIEYGEGVSPPPPSGWDLGRRPCIASKSFWKRKQEKEDKKTTRHLQKLKLRLKM